MKNGEVKERFILLRGRGFSYDKISKQLNVSKPTLLSWSAELSERVSEAKLLELDAVLQEFALSKVERVKLFAGLLRKASEELAKRDYSNVRTERLLELVLRLQESVLAEIGTVAQEFKFPGAFDVDLSALDGKRVRLTALD